MATVCKTCRHYQKISYDKFETDIRTVWSKGICSLQLPAWVHREIENEEVDGMDTCDLWNIDKDGNV